MTWLSSSSTRARSLLELAGSRFSLPALGAQLIWSVNVSTMKLTVAELDPHLVGMARAFIAGVALMIVVARVEKGVRLQSRHWPRMLLVAVVGSALSNVLWQMGLARSTASNAALISNVSPIGALALAVVLGQERLVPIRVAGMLLGLGGVALVVQSNANGAGTAGGSMLGDLLLLGSAFSWASYNVLAVPLLRVYSPLRVTAWGMLLGSASLLVLSPLGVQSWDVSHASATAWLGFAYALILATAVAQILWTRAVRALGASGTMIYGYLMPVLALAVAAVLLGERVGPAQALGAACVLGGVTLANSGRSARRKGM